VVLVSVVFFAKALTDFANEVQVAVALGLLAVLILVLPVVVRTLVLAIVLIMAGTAFPFALLLGQTADRLQWVPFFVFH
jgi:hypothetical protein